MDEILNFNKEFDVSLLDKLIDNQNDQKVGTILNQFMNDKSSWTRIETILTRSRNERTLYFGLTLLERVIKKQWRQLTIEQRHPVLNLLLSIVNLQNGNQSLQLLSTSSLLRKKSSSLIAKVLVKEYPSNWLVFIENLLKLSTQQREEMVKHLQQLMQQQQQSNTTASPPISNNTTIEVLILIFKELATNFKLEIVNKEYDTYKLVSENQKNQDRLLFDRLYEECKSFLVLASSFGNSTHLAQLANDSLQAMSSMFELVDIATLLQSYTMIVELSVIPQIRGTSILVLVEYLTVLLSSSSKFDQKSTIPTIFKSIIEKLSKFIPNTFKEINNLWSHQSILITNVSNLLSFIYKNYLPLLESQAIELKEYIMVGENQMILLAYIDDPTIYANILEYWKLKYESMVTPNQQFILSKQDRIELYSPLVQPILKVLTKMLKSKDLDLVEDKDNVNHGILYKEDSENSNDLSLQNDIITSLSNLYSQTTLNYFIGKMTLIKKKCQNDFNTNKYSSVVYLLSFVLNSDGVDIGLIPKVIDELYQIKDIAQGGQFKELVSISVLAIIRNVKRFYASNNTLVNGIDGILQLLIQWIPNSIKTQVDLLEMTIYTLNQVIKERGIQLVLLHDAEKYCTLLNNIVIENFNNLTTSLKGLMYESIGTILYNYILARKQPSPTLLPLILNPLNKTLTTSTSNLPTSEGSIGEWSQMIQTILSINTSLAKTSKSVYMQQFQNILPSLQLIVNWAITQSSNNSNTVITNTTNIKKSVLELIETCTINTPSTNSDLKFIIEQVYIPIFTLLLQDKSIGNTVTVSQYLPKTIQTLKIIFEKCGSSIPLDLGKAIVSFFMIPSLKDAISQSQASKGQQLINRIWELIYVLLSTSIQSLNIEIVQLYFGLIEISIKNTSPIIYIGALESLSNYFIICDKQPENIRNYLLDSNLTFNLLKLLFEIILYNSEFSQEKFSKTLFDLLNISPNLKPTILEYYQFKLQSSQVELFRDLLLQTNYDNFEQYIKKLISLF